MRKVTVAAASILGAIGFAPSATATNVSPDVIFGSGNANGSFTVETITLPSGSPFSGDIELGLRAKLRYDDAGAPQNIFNWNGIDTYTFRRTAGTPSNRSVFNFEWSINTADVAALEVLLNAEAYALIEYDTDPTAGTSFTSYQPLDFDAWYGTSSTSNGGGTYVPNTTPPGNSQPESGATVAQNSVNYGFLAGAPLGGGTYDVRLSAFNAEDDLLGATEIEINVVPLPPALPMLAAGVGGLAWLGRRRRKAA